MTERTHVYVSVEFADRIKAAEDNKVLQEQVINDIIQKQKTIYKGEVEYLEEATLAFKQFCVTHRNRLTEAYDEEADKLQKLIDTVSNNHTKVRDSARNLAQQIAPLKDEVRGVVSGIEELDKRLSCINTYRLKDTLDIVERIAALDEKSQSILLKVLGEK
jgi:uncharacterized phage infection (PIP) family protein YhgE